MRRALWFLPLLGGVAGWLFARRSGRPALPAAVTRALEPAVSKPRTQREPTERGEVPPAAPLKRARLPWSHGSD